MLTLLIVILLICTKLPVNISNRTLRLLALPLRIESNIGTVNIQCQSPRLSIQNLQLSSDIWLGPCSAIVEILTLCLFWPVVTSKQAELLIEKLFCSNCASSPAPFEMVIPSINNPEPLVRKKVVSCGPLLQSIKLIFSILKLLKFLTINPAWFFPLHFTMLGFWCGLYMKG